MLGVRLLLLIGACVALVGRVGGPGWSTAAAESVWETYGREPDPNTHVVGDVQTFLAGDGLHVRGWVVDAFSATRPDLVDVANLVGEPLAAVRSGGFERRPDVAERFGSSAYALSGFDVVLADPPTTLLIRAHLGQLGWWSTTVVAPVPRRARVTRFECVSPDRAEVEVTSAEPFPVRNALTELAVGGVVSSFNRYPDNGDPHTLIFSLTADQLAAIVPTDSAVVRYNPSNGQDVWQVGRLDLASTIACRT